MTASVAFRRLACEYAATKRAPEPVSGLVGTPVVYLTGLRCTPVDPISAEISARAGTGAPMETHQTFIAGDGLDIVAGDYLVVRDKTYNIRAVEDWRWDARTITQRLTLEELKR